MKLCEACHSPLPAIGHREGFRPNGVRRGRRRGSRFLAIQVPTSTDFLVSQMSTHDSVQKSKVVSLQRGDSSRISRGLCKVLWSIEADAADGQLVYVCGDLVALGCWDPDTAIPLVPSKENTNVWKAEVKIPSGILFKYNYFIRGKGQSASNYVWRPGPAFSLSVPSTRKRGEHITVRDLWVVSPIEEPPFSLWCSLMDAMDYASFHAVENPPASPRGKFKLAPTSEADELETERSVDVNIANVAVMHDVQSSTYDPGHVICEKDQPVEEPWLLISTSLSLIDTSLVNDAHGQKKEATGITLQENAFQGVENVTRKVPEELSLVRMEDSVSTVILINSSVCTMQRIAILEDDKLVELLLEPVKNNVQCDSVYLGVVTKLVPHMGGAFVDIGISRPSLMDIKRNRDPFAYPPFVKLTHTHELNGSVMAEQKGYLDVGDSEMDLYPDDRINEVIVDESVQYIHEDLDEHEIEDTTDDSVTYRSSVDSNVDYNGVEADSEFYYEDIGDITERETNESYTSDARSSNTTKQSGTSQDTTEAIVEQSDENKWSHVCKGTKIIVQVVKEGLGTKGPALTAYPNLRSRFWILITQCNRIGVSKKITGVERIRLRIIAKTLQPPGFGLTVRTVAAGHSLEELQKDLEGLLFTWKEIVEHAKSAALAADEGVEGAVPALLHRAMGQTLSVVQDYFNDKVKIMVVDSPRTYHEVTSYLQEIAPDLCDRVILHSKRTPIFDDYGIEEEINNILTKRVPLSNGGSLVIEQTEALVSIDVNGGLSMMGQGTSQEKAVLDVNLAAAKQIARELRLRDIGGIIVVDFIDMADEAHKRLVYEEMKKEVERDRSMVKVSELSRHGLMEITRKRVRPSVSFLISEPCSFCHATGRVEALETSFSKIEHEICRMVAALDQKADTDNAKSWPRFVLKVDRYMCNYLTSGKRTKLAILSSSLRVWILLKVVRGFAQGVFEVRPFVDGKTSDDDRPVMISRLHSAEARSYIPSSKFTVFPVKKWKARGK